MRSYHFDLGNSNDGPIGFCAVVEAHSPEEALRKLREALPDFIEVKNVEDDDIEYLNVYFNPDAVTTKDIDDEWEEE